MAPEPGQMISRYRLVEKIAEGGMGVVYKVLDTRLGRHVALKLLRPDLTADPARRARFFDEARAAASVSHPNIAAIYEIDEADGATFIVMELVEGRTLRHRIEEGSLAIPEALRIADGLSKGLARAHQAGVVHRDLKPENIIVGPDLHAKILDFGLACVRRGPEASSSPGADPDEIVTRDLPSGGGLIGTVSYMSPEQARGDPLDARSDVFSFGIILYEMLAGRRPFQGRNIPATLAAIIAADPAPLPALRPDVPPALETVVARCLARAPRDRYENGRELARDLEKAAVAAAPGPGAGLPPPGGPLTAVSPTTIAVFPFSVRGAPEYDYLGAGLVDLLSTKLDGAGDLRSVDAHVVLCCTEPAAGGAPDPATARDAARRFGAGLFVLGNVLALGHRLHLDASLYDATVGTHPVSKASVSGKAEAIFEMVDTLTAQLLTGRCPGPATRLTQIAATTTDSFSALKAYLEGEHAMRAMSRVAAVEAFQRAVSMDPRFALAWYRLSVAALWCGRSRLAIDAARQAVSHADRLTERDRMLLEAFAACLEGRNDEAERRFRNIVGAYPDDVEAWYQLGELLFHCGPLRGRPIEESRQAWERLLALDPKHVNGMVHLALIESRAGNQERLETLFARVLDLSPAGDPLIWMRAFRAFSRDDENARGEVVRQLRGASDYNVTFAVRFLGGYLGDPDGALSFSHLLVDPLRSPEVRALGHVIRAHLELAGGRRRDCLREIAAARAIAPGVGLEYEALLATALFLETDRSDLAALRSRVAALAEPPAAPDAALGSWLSPHEGLHPELRLYLLGVIDAMLGHGDLAMRQAETLEVRSAAPGVASIVADLACSVRAHAAFTAGRDEEALDHLESSRMESRFDLTMWSPFHSQARERFLRAELLRRTGREEEAIPWYGSFAENSTYDLIYFAPSLLSLGAIHERLGETRLAVLHYERLAGLWKGCDEDLAPRVAEARSRLAQIAGGR